MSLVSKIIAPILIAGNFLVPNFGFSQENSKEKFIPQTYLSSRVGLYFDSEDKIIDKYGPFLAISLGAIRDFSKDFRGEAGFGLSLASEKSNTYSGADKLTIISFFGNIQAAPKKKPDQTTLLYARAGIFYDHIREKINSNNESYNASNNGFGITAGGGIELILNSDINSKSFLDAIFLEALYESISTERLDRSGFKISVGFENRL